jgi:hypothetical protein
VCVWGGGELEYEVLNGAPDFGGIVSTIELTD